MPLPASTPRAAAIAARLDDPCSSSFSSAVPLSSQALIPLRPGEISLRHQKILTEDEYTSSVSDIIKRDFFPHLDRLRAENDYLSALEDGDNLKISRALKRLIALEDAEKGSSKCDRHASSTPRGTPAAPGTARAHRQDPGETPLRPSRDAQGWEDTPAARSVSGDLIAYSRYPGTNRIDATSQAAEAGDDNQEPSGFDPDLSLSLDAFQSSYTSEDNASFSQIMDRANRLRREKFAWAFEAEQRANDKKRKAIEGAQREATNGKRLAIAASAAQEPSKRLEVKERLLIEDAREGVADAKSSEDGEASKVASVIDDGDASAPQKDDASIPSWKFKTRNALMYGPDADISTSHSRNSSLFPTSSTSSSLTHSLLKEALDNASTSKPSVNYRSTGFPLYEEGESKEDGNSVVPGTPSSSKIDAAIRGSVAASSVTGETSADRGTGTPRVAGYGFVGPYQTPVPATPVDAANQEERRPRLRGLGTSSIFSTDVETSQQQPFVLPPTRQREHVANRLAGSATRSLRDKVASSSSAKPGSTTPYGAIKYTGLALRTGGGHFGLTPSSRGGSTKKKREDLTPAAKRLLDMTSRGGLTPTPRTKTLGESLLARRAGDERARREREHEEAARLDQFRRQRWDLTPSPVPQQGRDGAGRGR